MRILLASNNANKCVEIEALLGPLDVSIVMPADVGGIEDVEEDEPTFAGNAAKKAVAAAREKSMWALADDSGLVVDALHGAPGVLSARYAGEHGDDAGNNERLLSELGGLAPAERSAHFACALALADPNGVVRLEVEGRVDGRILDSPRGDSGFGYDPLFLPSCLEGEHSFAELALEEKAEVSHRGRALRELAARLPEILHAETRN